MLCAVRVQLLIESVNFYEKSSCVLIDLENFYLTSWYKEERNDFVFHGTRLRRESEGQRG